MNPLTLLDLFSQPLFQRGLATGGLALVLVLAVRRAGWLLAWSVAAVAAIAWAGLLHGTPGTPDWAVPVVTLVAVGAAFAFHGMTRRVPPWAAGIVFALWVLGVWGTVPDTERAGITMGVTAAMLPALWPGLKVRVGWEGAAPAVAALGFVTVTDGAARTAAMIGALGFVGMPLVVVVAARWLRSDRRLSPWWLIAAMAVHVIVSGRVAGQLYQREGSLVVVILSALVTGGGLAWGLAAPPTRPPSGGR